MIVYRYPYEQSDVYYFAMLRVCYTCGATVRRKDCHKNRYSEYICRRCQAAGKKFTSRGRRRHIMKRALPVFLWGSAVASLLLVAMWMNLLTFDSFSFFNGEREALIDIRKGVSLNAPISARMASPGQSASPPKKQKP